MAALFLSVQIRVTNLPWRQALWLSALLALTALVYWPGLSGPFLFDDVTNILRHEPLRVTDLTFDSLWRASWSLESGPLKRPLAYLSFALNHYFAGGYSAPAFKTTNLIIHLLCIPLVAGLAWRLSVRLLLSRPEQHRSFALLTAAIFAFHPLALSPVLYVVQRMASLSAFFSLAALLCLLQARDRLGVAIRSDRSHNQALSHEGYQRAHALPPKVHAWLVAGFWLAFGGVLAACGLLSKENAALLPLLYLLADRICFPEAPYWRWLVRPGRGGRLTRLGVWLGAASAAGMLAWYVAPGYAVRHFTLSERLLTEGRVLWFYLSLFALPRINAFGLYHDDIAISTSLIDPWTTMPALLGLIVLAVVGFKLLARASLVGFGLLWFLAGHLMESTLIPLEIAHEHRNYLPMVGLACASAWLLLRYYQRSPKLAVVAGCVILVTLSATTALRATQWQDSETFLHFQVMHHPESASSRNEYASVLGKQRRYVEGMEQLRIAQRIAPWEAGYYLNYFLIARSAKLEVPAEVAHELEALARSRPLTPLGERALQNQTDCLRTICGYMAADLVRWLTAYRDSPVRQKDDSQLEYFLGLAFTKLGKWQSAINAFERAHTLDPNYLHPLFEQANIFMALNQWDNAEFNLQRLREVNPKALVRQDKALQELEAAIAKGRAGKSAEHKPAAAP